jgi:DNA repair protein RecO (recombination protein O)
VEASRTYRADGIVLRRVNIGETDRVVTLFTRSKGKIGTIAKGARKALSKLAAATEPFIYGRYMLAVGQNLDVMTQVEIRESFPDVRKDVERVGHAMYFLELVDSFLDEREPNREIFDTLLSSLYMLEGGVVPQVVARSFELKLLVLLGYGPQLSACIRCGATPKKGETLAYSPSLGGLVCRQCGPLPDDVIYLHAETVAAMRRLLAAEPAELRGMNLPSHVLKEAEQALRWHTRYRLERDLKSTEFLQSLVQDAERRTANAE